MTPAGLHRAVMVIEVRWWAVGLLLAAAGLVIAVAIAKGGALDDAAHEAAVARVADEARAARRAPFHPGVRVWHAGWGYGRVAQAPPLPGLAPVHYDEQGGAVVFSRRGELLLITDDDEAVITAMRERAVQAYRTPTPEEGLPVVPPVSSPDGGDAIVANLTEPCRPAVGHVGNLHHPIDCAIVPCCSACPTHAAD